MESNPSRKRWDKREKSPHSILVRASCNQVQTQSKRYDESYCEHNCTPWMLSPIRI